jgi:hypothetical protein
MIYDPAREKELLNRAFLHRMGVRRAPCFGSQRSRTTENSQQSRGPQRHLRHCRLWMYPAVIASRPRTFREAVCWWFRRRCIDGSLEYLNTVLRERVRTSLGRTVNPSVGFRHCQSARTTTGVGGEQIGYDGSRKLRRKKRHLLMDTEGLVLSLYPQRKRSQPGWPEAATGLSAHSGV